jgi:hypothetical protein
LRKQVARYRANGYIICKAADAAGLNKGFEMLTKNEFFQTLRDIRANITTRICIRVENKTFTGLVAEQTSAPNAFLSRHKDDAALAKTFAKYDAWLNEWFMNLDAMIAADHAEALEMDKQATHFRREQSALTERVNKIMGKDTVVDMNKARQKQQQTPLNLPKPQMIDVLRAALRKTGNATDAHIEAVADMSEASMKKSLSGMLAKGARVTAYLTKSKSLGYGAITFGIDGQLPPGLYHAFRVGSMKEARSVAAQYGAMSWNF